MNAGEKSESIFFKTNTDSLIEENEMQNVSIKGSHVQPVR